MPPVTRAQLEADQDALTRLFTNLLQNARRYAPADGEIIVRAIQHGDHVVVTVADNGPGLAAEHLARLGERFYRADSARDRNSGGSGLGLAICREIARTHGGTISFESIPGKGFTARLDLPSPDLGEE